MVSGRCHVVLVMLDGVSKKTNKTREHHLMDRSTSYCWFMLNFHYTCVYMHIYIYDMIYVCMEDSYNNLSVHS